MTVYLPVVCIVYIYKMVFYEFFCIILCLVMEFLWSWIIYYSFFEVFFFSFLFFSFFLLNINRGWLVFYEIKWIEANADNEWSLKLNSLNSNWFLLNKKKFGNIKWLAKPFIFIWIFEQFSQAFVHNLYNIYLFQ